MLMRRVNSSRNCSYSGVVFSSLFAIIGSLVKRRRRLLLAPGLPESYSLWQRLSGFGIEQMRGRSSSPSISGQNGTREDQMKHHPMGAGVLALVAIWTVAFASTAAALDRVRVGKAVPFAWTFTPIDVGIAVGIFAKHGLELEVTGFAGDARLQQGLVSDSIDFGLGSGAGMGFLAKGVPAKAVAAMAGARMNMSMVVSYDSPIKTLDDIKGKRVGITTVGSLTDWLLKRVVSEKKWAPTDVTAVTVGGMDSTKAALKTGQIDAVVIALELGYALEAAKEWRVVSLLAPFAPDFARDELIANKPE